MALVALAGCAATGPSRVGIPAGYVGETAQIKGSGGANFIRFLTEGEVHTSLKSIDGSAPAAEYIVLPGTHVFDVFLTHMGVSYLGTTEITVPAPGSYILVGRRRGARFEVALVRETTGETEASPALRAIGARRRFIFRLL